jgi:hypothetical protein
MTTFSKNNLVIRMGTVLLFVGVAVYPNMSAAQVETTTTTIKEKATKTVKVENGTVVHVSGDSLIVKMADGSLRHFNNLPDSFRVTVSGKQLGLPDLQPGMKLQRTITTTTTPETIKTVKTVTGTVWFVNPPRSVILTLDDGKNQQFTIPKGQKFNINGQMVDAFGLQKGMKISATKIVESPAEAVTQQAKVTGTMPAPPPPPAPDVAILVVEEEEVQTVPVETAQAAPAPAALPTTASPIPLIGLLGIISLASSLGLRTFRPK